MTLTAREAPLEAQAAVIAPNAWHRIDCRNSRAVTILVGPDHPWFRYIKPMLNGQPIVPLDPPRYAVEMGRALDAISRRADELKWPVGARPRV